MRGTSSTLDNRRLAAFQNAKIKSVPIQKVSLDDPRVWKDFDGKYNPINEGKNIVVIPNSSNRTMAEDILRNMVRLNNPKRKELAQEDFEQYPVWVWDDEMEYKLPISDTEPSRYDYGVFFIKTKFKTASYHFDGYFNWEQNILCIGIFVIKEEFYFKFKYA